MPGGGLTHAKAALEAAKPILLLPSSFGRLPKQALHTITEQINKRNQALAVYKKVDRDPVLIFKPRFGSMFAIESVHHNQVHW